MPTRFTRVGPLPCQFFLDAQYAESLISRRDPFPLLPVDLSDTTSQPFVCSQGEFRHRRTSKVPNPPIYVCLELSSKGVEALPPTPRSQFLELTQAFVTELLVRPISHDRLPVSLSLNPESKTKGFDVRGADWANLRLVLVDLQEQLSALRLRCSTNSPIPLRFCRPSEAALKRSVIVFLNFDRAPDLSGRLRS